MLRNRHTKSGRRNSHSASRIKDLEQNLGKVCFFCNKGFSKAQKRPKACPIVTEPGRYACLPCALAFKNGDEDVLRKFGNVRFVPLGKPKPET